MGRRKDADWIIPEGQYCSTASAQLAVLMDIRDELKQLNGLLHCSNFVGIPGVLRGIRAKLPTRRRKKRVARG